MPILFVSQGIEIRAHRLVNVNPPRRPVAHDHTRYLSQAQIVGLHHYTDKRDRSSQPDTARRLLVDQRPIAGTALRILLAFSGVIQGKFDVVKRPNLVIR